jgi:hypothetical protein
MRTYIFQLKFEQLHINVSFNWKYCISTVSGTEEPSVEMFHKW